MRAPGGIAPWRLSWGRLRAFLWRFRTLPFAERLFAGVAPGTVLARPFCGFALAVDVSRSSTERLLYLDGERQVAERFLLRSLLTPGGSVADVGGNVGYYALLFAAGVGPRGRVFCFEPEPTNFRFLAHNVRANGLTQVELHACALGEATGTVRLEPGLNGHVVAGGELEVPVARLDDLVGAELDLLKIDVDGFEGPVLAGARRVLTEVRPTLFLELHPQLIPPPESAQSILAALAPLYPRIELWRAARGRGLAARLRQRYGRAGIERLPDPQAFLADLESGRERDTFWALCRRPEE